MSDVWDGNPTANVFQIWKPAIGFLVILDIADSRTGWACYDNLGIRMRCIHCHRADPGHVPVPFELRGDKASPFFVEVWLD
jgi:hypothetical protein